MAMLKPERTGDILKPMAIGASIVMVLALPWAAHRLGSWLRRLRSIEPRANRRRALREVLFTPLFVYGWMLGRPFSENTHSLNASALGGLMPLSASVVASQTLVVTNLRSNEDLRCRVVRLGQAESGIRLVGFEFLQASPDFWRIERGH
jgi:hypothetical protein